MEELKAIPLELMKLREKKSNAEAEVKNLFNDKIKLLEDIGNIQKQKVECQKALKGEQEKLSQAKEESKEANAEIKANKAEAQKILDDAVDKQIKIDNGFKEIEESKVDLDNREATLKEERRRHEVQVKLLIDAREKLGLDQNDFIRNLARLDQNVAAHKEQVEALFKKQDEVSENAAKVQELKIELENKNGLAKKQNELLSHKEQALDAEKEKNVSLQKQLETKIDELNSQINEFDSKNKALIRRIDDLNNQERVTKIRELRVAKLIKDHDLQKELNDLEQSLR